MECEPHLVKFAWGVAPVLASARIWAQGDRGQGVGMARTRRVAGADLGTKARIVSTTSEHLARLGPRALELRAICAEVDVSPSLVNYYFRSTEDLIWQAALHSYGGHVAGQAESLLQAADGRQALEGWIRRTIEWTREHPGIAALIDFPMLALEGQGADPEDLTRDLADLSRRNVATLASAIYAHLAERPVRALSVTKVGLLIKVNASFAYWTSMVGFASLGAAMWVAGRRPHSFLWRAFGFSPDAQIDDVIDQVLARIEADRREGTDTSEIVAVVDGPE